MGHFKSVLLPSGFAAYTHRPQRANYRGYFSSSNTYYLLLQKRGCRRI